MHVLIEKYCRDLLKHNLSKCTEEQQTFFKRLYSHKKPERVIQDIVDEMSIDDRFHNAISQVERTLIKNGGVFEEPPEKVTQCNKKSLKNCIDIPKQSDYLRKGSDENHTI